MENTAAKAHPRFRLCYAPQRMRPAKVRAQVCPLQLPEPCHSGPLSSVKVVRRHSGISHKRRTGASLKAAAVLLWALPSSRKRLLRSLRLTSADLSLEAQTRSASPVAYAGSACTSCGCRAYQPVEKAAAMRMASKKPCKTEEQLADSASFKICNSCSLEPEI